MNPGLEADRVLLAHMRDCLDWIVEYSNVERARFDASHRVKEAMIRNVQTFADALEQIEVGDCGYSCVSTDDRDKSAAKRPHPKVSNWRCRASSGIRPATPVASTPPAI